MDLQKISMYNFPSFFLKFDIYQPPSFLPRFDTGSRVSPSLALCRDKKIPTVRAAGILVFTQIFVVDSG
jgi:hypothetical protein